MGRPRILYCSLMLSSYRPLHWIYAAGLYNRRDILTRHLFLFYSRNLRLFFSTTYERAAEKKNRPDAG